MKKRLGTLLCVMLWTVNSRAENLREVRADLCIYGGTASGVIAACAARQQGKSVLLIEPGRHLGGMTSGGLGMTDTGNKAAIGGMSRDFYRTLGKVYGEPEVWRFEPHVAEKALNDLIAENKVEVVLNHRLVSAAKDGTRITKIILEAAPPDELGCPAEKGQGVDLAVMAAIYIDATYEGDLLAAAQVSYTVGRESAAQYGEPLNGVRAATPQHQFLPGVDPFMKPGDPKSGLLPLFQAVTGKMPGEGDKCVQAYNFRLCLTQDPANRLPIAPPKDYDPARYEILARHVEALSRNGKTPALKQLLKIDAMPGGKTDINNNGGVSTDFIGFNYDYPDGDYATRSKVWRAHLDHIRGLLHYLATSERIPKGLRGEMSSWGLCRDEFADTGGWPHQMYVREARRMIGRYVITQQDCEHARTVEDSIGMASYNMDSHNCQRLAVNGEARNEGDVQVKPKGPYAVSYRSITPKVEECSNLIVPVCVSSTHIAYGSVRMEPVFMILGQSAAMAACDAIDAKCAVQEIDVPALQKRLLAASIVLKPDAPTTQAKP